MELKIFKDKNQIITTKYKRTFKAMHCNCFYHIFFTFRAPASKGQNKTQSKPSIFYGEDFIA